MLRSFLISVLLVGAVLRPGLGQESGETLPDYRFGNLIGAQGEASLSDFKGRPVLLVRWTRDESGRAAINWAADIAKTYKKSGLEVILLPTKPWTTKNAQEELASLAIMAPSHEMILSEPVSWHYKVELADPSFLLVSSQGEMLLADGIDDRDPRFRKAMKADALLRKKGWGQTPVERKARLLAFVEGRLADAWKSLGSLNNDALREEIQAGVRARQAMIERLLDAGEYARAEDRLVAFRDDMAVIKYFRELGDALVLKLETEDAKAGLQEDRVLAGLIDRIRAGQVTEKSQEQLRDFAEKASHKAVIERAKTWVEVADAQIRLRAAEIDFFAVGGR